MKLLNKAQGGTQPHRRPCLGALGPHVAGTPSPWPGHMDMALVWFDAGKRTDFWLICSIRNAVSTGSWAISPIPVDPI